MIIQDIDLKMLDGAKIVLCLNLKILVLTRPWNSLK
jgi:hypothetical protein